MLLYIRFIESYREIVPMLRSIKEPIAKASPKSDNCFVPVREHISRSYSIVLFQPLTYVLKKQGGKDWTLLSCLTQLVSWGCGRKTFWSLMSLSPTEKTVLCDRGEGKIKVLSIRRGELQFQQDWPCMQSSTKYRVIHDFTRIINGSTLFWEILSWKNVLVSLNKCGSPWQWYI